MDTHLSRYMHVLKYYLPRFTAFRAGKPARCGQHLHWIRWGSTIEGRSMQGKPLSQEHCSHVKAAGNKENGQEQPGVPGIRVPWSWAIQLWSGPTRKRVKRAPSELGPKDAPGELFCWLNGDRKSKHGEEYNTYVLRLCLEPKVRRRGFSFSIFCRQPIFGLVRSCMVPIASYAKLTRGFCKTQARSVHTQGAEQALRGVLLARLWPDVDEAGANTLLVSA